MVITRQMRQRKTPTAPVHTADIVQTTATTHTTATHTTTYTSADATEPEVIERPARTGAIRWERHCCRWSLSCAVCGGENAPACLELMKERVRWESIV